MKIILSLCAVFLCMIGSAFSIGVDWTTPVCGDWICDESESVEGTEGYCALDCGGSHYWFGDIYELCEGPLDTSCIDGICIDFCASEGMIDAADCPANDSACPLCSAGASSATISSGTLEDDCIQMGYSKSSTCPADLVSSFKCWWWLLVAGFIIGYLYKDKKKRK